MVLIRIGDNLTMKKIIKHFRKNWIRYGFETLVVTVGILGAFALDNWNESHKIKDMEAKYLNNLIVDLSANTGYFENQIELMNDAIKKQNTFILMSYEKQRTVEDFFKLFSFYNLDTEHLTIQNPTYTDLINAGHLNIFSNERVKYSIMAYYKLYEEYSINIKEYNLVSTEYMIEADHVAPSAIKYMNLSKYYTRDMYFEGELEYMNNPLSKEFLAVQEVMSVYLDRNEKHINYYRTLKESANILIKKIKEELSEKSY